MLQSMSATELATWRALASLEHETGELIRGQHVDPQTADQMVWHIDEQDGDDDNAAE
jgi:hypothetical protein